MEYARVRHHARSGAAAVSRAVRRRHRKPDVDLQRKLSRVRGRLRQTRSALREAEAEVERLKRELRWTRDSLRDPVPGIELPESVNTAVARVRAEKLTYLSVPNLQMLARLVLDVERSGRPGLIIEAGTARGGSAIVMAAAKSADRPMKVYDVFGMIPRPTDHDGEDVHARYATILSGQSKGVGGDAYYGYRDNLYDEVSDSFRRFGVPAEEANVSLVKGLSEDTIDLDEPVALAHPDGDWYESTMTCLTRIAPLLVPGGRIVLDDYYAWSGCRTAVDEYFSDRPGFSWSAERRCTSYAPDAARSPSSGIHPGDIVGAMYARPPRYVHGLPRPGRCLVMGVVNVTPDSFSDGGRWHDPELAVAHGAELLAEGADLLDVGGESTRPGATRPLVAEELDRVIPVVAALADLGAAVSVDTMRAEVADAALEAGAVLVNDVSGGLSDPEILQIVARRGAAYAAMHWRAHADTMVQHAEYGDVVVEVMKELTLRIEAALAAGIDESRLAVDPGLGFAKAAAHNWALLAGLDQLHELNLPIMVGASRKSFLGGVLADAMDEPRPVLEREDATTALTTLSAAAGVWCVRVHSVRANIDAVKVVARWARVPGSAAQRHA